MKNNFLIFILFLVVAAFGFTSCDDYLDIAPDNRTELDTKAKITSWLVSGYPRNSFVMATEMASDNIDCRVFPENLTYSNKNQEDCYRWNENADQTGNDSPTDMWVSFYNSIDVANRAIQAIEDLGNPAELAPQRGEALMIRAFCHFILVNTFSLHYNEATAGTDLGIPYLDKPNIVLNPQVERGTVAEVYAKIEKDIEEGLPLIDDNAYAVAPKYHFNRRASYALASRFYLYYGKYDKSLEYSNRILGEGNPDQIQILRNMNVYTTLTSDVQIRCREWINPANDCNFLIISHTSALGNLFANYSTGKLYQHSYMVTLHETFRSPGPWRQSGYASGDWYLTSGLYSSGYVIYFKTPYVFEYTDPIARTGYSHTIYAAFTSDEVLLNRAEAYIVKGEYDKATADLNRWMRTYVKNGVVLTRDLINSYYGNLAYYTPTQPTAKKELHPLNFTFEGNGTEQENYLQCLLHFRRIETVFMGLRWFDVKRFGIKIYRRNVDYRNSADAVVAVTDSLELNDPRRAIQLPSDVIDAGLTPNPRN
ncbi:MAG: RagB/SusD family nutrient uptake outer membrane protein [Dysgonamonadaceae bacterium]|jgi:tetratricopeptide (TPR) repeat protein|nr:RagB/SusD family nutrient uptake outer membrane protein [Dysgonamonadaceae bacterium]